MKKYWLPLALILLVAVGLTPFLRSFVREIVVIPLLYLFWIGRFIFEAIPQSTLWLGVVSALTIMMAVSLLGRRPARPKPHHISNSPPGRVAGWSDLINKAREDDYFKWRLAQRLQRLTLSALAHHQRRPLKEIRRELRQGTLDLPPDLAAYFQASLQPLGELSRPKKLFARPAAASPLDLDPVKVVQFLNQLNNNPTRQELP